MIEYIVQGIKWLMDFWGLLPESVKENVKTQAVDSFDDIFRKFFNAATDEASRA